jgi:hypothetical protein
MSQKSAQSLRMGHCFSDGLWGLVVVGKRLTSLGALLVSRYLGFGTLPGAIRTRSEHRQRVRCTSQIRGLVQIGRDRGQHRPQLLCGARQIGAADLLAHAGHRTPAFVPLGFACTRHTWRAGCRVEDLWRLLTYLRFDAANISITVGAANISLTESCVMITMGARRAGI